MVKNWKCYDCDYDWFGDMVKVYKILILLGDIYELDFCVCGCFYEVIVSVMVQLLGIMVIFGKKMYVFGLLMIGDYELWVEVYVGFCKVEDYIIDWLNWIVDN